MKQTQMKVGEFPDYVEKCDAVQRATAELQRITERRAEIQADLSAKVQPQDENEWDQFVASGATGVYPCCTNDVELREEYADLDRREQFLRKVLEQGRQELDKILGAISLQLCNKERPAFVEQTRRILEAVKVICEGNRTLERMRNDLEAAGVRTGSLATGVFEIGGNWSDEFGGRVVGYQRFIAEFYPELRAAAGQEIQAKRRELDSKIQSFEGVEA